MASKRWLRFIRTINARASSTISSMLVFKSSRADAIRRLHFSSWDRSCSHCCASWIVRFTLGFHTLFSYSASAEFNQTVSYPRSRTSWEIDFLAFVRAFDRDRRYFFLLFELHINQAAEDPTVECWAALQRKLRLSCDAFLADHGPFEAWKTCRRCSMKWN
jgi:hypothetical protein